jgi:hypothetical protein
MEPHDKQRDEKARLLARLKAQGVNLDTLERRKLDAHTEARIFDNGTLIVYSDWNGFQLVLNATKAAALLDLLSAHRDTLLRFSALNEEEDASSQEKGG